MRLLPFRYFITKRYLFHFTLKSLVLTILTRPFFSCALFLSLKHLETSLRIWPHALQGNSWCISVNPLSSAALSILCSVERARFRAGNFTCVFSSLVCSGTTILTLFPTNVLLLTGVCVQRLLSVRGKWGASKFGRGVKKLSWVDQRERQKEGGRVYREKFIHIFFLTCWGYKVQQSIRESQLKLITRLHQSGLLHDETVWTSIVSSKQRSVEVTERWKGWWSL